MLLRIGHVYERTLGAIMSPTGFYGPIDMAIGPDGMLYVSNFVRENFTFDPNANFGSEIYRVNPETGEVELYADVGVIGPAPITQEQRHLRLPIAPYEKHRYDNRLPARLADGLYRLGATGLLLEMESQ